jgi:site-specific DNA recombinase
VSKQLRVAVYARVSSEQQAGAGTISSQLEALKEKVRGDGFDLERDFTFIDEGYSGGTLIRPALERLRDLSALGALDRVYVHSPDRLARNYAYQVLLLDELQHAGVEVVFLNHTPGKTPEDKLLLQVQGMVAEYERAKILERSRRGKLHAARRGSVSVLSRAPYGYEYVPGGGTGHVAEVRVSLEHARIARQIFEWVGKDRWTLSAICRKLRSEGIPSPTGKPVWCSSTLVTILRNPAYKGSAAYGKRRRCELRLGLRRRHGWETQRPQSFSLERVPAEEWIPIEVPAIVGEDLFAAVQEQLVENRRISIQHPRGATHLLQGLVICARCKYALVGTRADLKNKRYSYYRCTGSRLKDSQGSQLCRCVSLRAAVLEEAVWTDVCALLENPTRIEDEFERRLKGDAGKSTHHEQTEARLRKLERGGARLIDAYSDGLLEKDEFEPRLKATRERITALKAELQAADDESERRRDLQLAYGRIEDFARRVRAGIQGADWHSRREIITALVKQIEVGDREVKIVYRVDPRPELDRPSHAGLQPRTPRAGEVPRSAGAGQYAPIAPSEPAP